MLVKIGGQWINPEHVTRVHVDRHQMEQGVWIRFDGDGCFIPSGDEAAEVLLERIAKQLQPRRMVIVPPLSDEDKAKIARELAESPMQVVWPKPDKPVSDEAIEKRHRIYYQNIVYKVCNELERAFSERFSRGQSVACGTVDSPSTQVETLMAELVERDTKAYMKLFEQIGKGEVKPNFPNAALPGCD